MDDITLIVIVLVVAIGGIAGVAYLLDRRRKASGPVGPALPEPGPMSKALLWGIRGLVVVMVLSIVGVFVFQAFFLVWVAAGGLVVYMIVRSAYRVMRLAGK